MRLSFIRASVTAGAFIGAGLFATAAQADSISTFDTTISPFTAGSDFNAGVVSPPSATFSTAQNSAGAAGSGSVLFSQDFDGTPGGKAAFTATIFGAPTDATNISFDLLVDPASATTGAGGNAGFFSVSTRLTNNYTFTGTSLGENLNSADFGTFQHINIPLTAAQGDALRAITIQDYNGSTPPITGTVNYYLDNLVVTTAPVPEPASLSLIGLAGAGLLARRKRRAW